jgi:hypothetical protein
MDIYTHVGVRSKDNWDAWQSVVQAEKAGRAWVSVHQTRGICFGVVLIQRSIQSFVAAHLLSPMLVTFKPKHEPAFEDVWAGAYCTFAKEISKGDIYVFGLNNYNQLGEFV